MAEEAWKISPVTKNTLDAPSPEDERKAQLDTSIERLEIECDFLEQAIQRWQTSLRNLQKQIKALEEERRDLEDGQLIFGETL